MILYKGKLYETRKIVIHPCEGGVTVMVAKEDLADELYPALRVGEPHAQHIDEQIMYYCDEVLWTLPDEALARFLEEL